MDLSSQVWVTGTFLVYHRRGNMQVVLVFSTVCFCHSLDLGESDPSVILFSSARILSSRFI